MHPRKLARSMARSQLEKDGATGVNKQRYVNGVKTPSYFSRVWRNYATKATVKKGARK